MLTIGRMKNAGGRMLLCAALVLAVALFPLAGTAHADGGLELSTSYPGITVKAGTDATFSLKVSNKTGMPQSVRLTAKDVPEGWDAVITGGGNPISKVYVDNDGSQSATLTVSIPGETSEGIYSLEVVAEADSGVKDTLVLELNVSEQEIKQGTFTVQYPSQKGPSSATFEFSTTIANNGSEDQTYNLSANAPAGWSVSLRRDTRTRR